MEKIANFLKDSGVYFLATCEGDQPRLRPFGSVALVDGKLYFTTNNQKKVFDQMIENPKVEISAMGKDYGWIRISGEVKHDDSLLARQKVIDAQPSLTSIFSADDGKMAVFYFVNGQATIIGGTGGDEVIPLT